MSHTFTELVPPLGVMKILTLIHMPALITAVINAVREVKAMKAVSLQENVNHLPVLFQQWRSNFLHFLIRTGMA